MERVNLPLETANEPKEDARQPEIAVDCVMPASKERGSRNNITFAEPHDDEERVVSQSTMSYKEVLSQPAEGVSHRHRLQWLQRRRSVGLWAQCERCKQWRHLPHVLDRHELPREWHCGLNTDKSVADCSTPETPIHTRDEEDLIHSEYAAGSLVWARLAGWPWWPAMVDDCPDTEQYYWLDGFSDIPTHYNVVFFDSNDTTRAWISPDNLMPYFQYEKTGKLSGSKKFKKRIDAATTQAKNAERLSLPERLAKYSFIARYKGSIVTPKKINKKDLLREKRKLERKFNIDFPIESDSDSEHEVTSSSQKEKQKRKNDTVTDTPIKIKKTTRKQKLGSNAKKAIEKEPVATEPKQTAIKVNATNDEKKTFEKEKSTEDDNTAGENINIFSANENVRTETDAISPIATNTTRDNSLVENQEESHNVTKDSGKLNRFKQPMSSLVVQVGSDKETAQESVENYTESLDNDTSKTYVPESSESQSVTSKENDTKEFTQDTQDISVRIPSPSSDDFDF